MLQRLALLAMLLSTSVAAQQVGSDDSTFADGILVTSSDVTNCPYRFVQPVTVSITEDWGQDARARVFDKLRDLARKTGADAVVLVTKGNAHMTMWAWTRREYTGRAIRYVDRGCAPTQ